MSEREKAIEGLNEALEAIKSVRDVIRTELKQEEEAKVIVCSDSNWAAPKSTSGWLISWNNCTLQTAAKTQSSPALSIYVLLPKPVKI